MNAIADGKSLQHLYYLLEFLAAWGERPECLTPIAYRWCSAISEVAGRLGRREISITQPHPSRCKLDQEVRRLNDLTPIGTKLGLRLRLGHRDLALGEGQGYTSWVLEAEFARVGPDCDLLRLDDTSHHARRGQFEDLDPLEYANLLSTTLEIGFRLASPRHLLPAFRFGYTSHHDWVFETAFSSHDDEVIADAVCAWVTDGNYRLPGSCIHYLAKRMERDAPFSARLRRATIRAIELIWCIELIVSEPETVRLLDRLDVDMDDMVEDTWGSLLVGVVRSPAGPGSLSSHYWRLLDKLVSSEAFYASFGPGSVEAMRTLEEAGDWEKLEVWMAVAWRSQLWPGSIEEIGQVTLKLLSRRPSALPKFEGLCEMETESHLRRICDQARTEQSPSPCVSVLPAQHPSDLMSLFSCSSQPTHAQSVVE